MVDEGTLRPSTYKPRIVDAQIERYLRLFGAVEVSGTKWCGKTWSSLAHGRSVTYVDRGSNLEVATADPGYALIGEPPHVIDEWQRVPAIWDTVRHAVDGAAGEKGLWLLTGSSTPSDDAVSHSGAGRIGRIRMHPMTLQESGDSSGFVSLAALFDGAFAPTQCEGGIEQIAKLVCRGGWPEQQMAAPEDAQVVVREYLASIFEKSVPRLGGDSSLAQRVAVSLARNLGQSSTNLTLARDAFALGEGASIRAAMALYGMKAAELVREGSGPRQLVPLPGTAEARRLGFERAHPALSALMAAGAWLVLAVALVTQAPNLINGVSFWTGLEVPAFGLPAWLNGALSVLSILSGLDRGLRMKHSPLLDD